MPRPQKWKRLLITSKKFAHKGAKELKKQIDNAILYTTEGLTSSTGGNILKTEVIFMRILFQGDSITDAGRNRADKYDLGEGYPFYAAALIKEKYPDKKFEFINKGVSGDRAELLLARWQEDAINIQPDVISILIGVNDTWHNSAPQTNWMKHEYFEYCYRTILEDVKKNTNAKIIMIEQFLLYTDDKAYFRTDLAPKIEITRKLAREYADAYIPMDGLFAKASVDKEPTFWAEDGVHPTKAGAQLMASYYLDAISPFIDSFSDN